RRGRARVHAAAAQHGHHRRQPAARHALQLLRPDVRVAQSDRLLHEEGWAVQSSDGAPVAVALGASVMLASGGGVRRVAAEDLYHNDGIHYLTKRPDELLVWYVLPPVGAWRASYVKLRRRGSFDFPVLGVAARVDFFPDGTVRDARIVLGAVASHPMRIAAAREALVGRPLDAASIADAADASFKPAKPMDNTDFTLSWRKEMVRVYVTKALEEIASQS